MHAWPNSGGMTQIISVTDVRERVRSAGCSGFSFLDSHRDCSLYQRWVYPGHHARSYSSYIQQWLYSGLETTFYTSLACMQQLFTLLIVPFLRAVSLLSTAYKGQVSTAGDGPAEQTLLPNRHNAQA